MEWLTVVLAEVALGGPAALRQTPVQAVVGAGLSVARFPVRQVARQVDSLLGKASRTLDTVGETSQDVAETLDDLQDRATTAVKQQLAPDEDELPVTGYDQLTKPRAIALVKTLSQPEDVRSVIAYEESHRNRPDVVSAAQVRLAEIAKDVVVG